MSFNIARTAAAVPRLTVADTESNLQEHIRLIDRAAESGCQLILFPELSLTGYSCGDLFFQDSLIKGALSALEKLCRASLKTDITVIAGLPLIHENRLYNCSAVIRSGEIAGIVPKIHIPGNREFYEQRWFSSGSDIQKASIQINSKEIPFGIDLIFKSGELSFGIEICEDLWSPVQPSSKLALAGALVVCNPSASNALVGKQAYRRQLISAQSGAAHCGYLYASSGVTESTTDLVFSGAALAGMNGRIIMESKRFSRESLIHLAEFDLGQLLHDRLQNPGFKSGSGQFYSASPADADRSNNREAYRRISLESAIPDCSELLHCPDSRPFVPSNPMELDERCREIFMIQASGLAKRMEHTGLKRAVIGISGGLDSTLALLVTVAAFDLLELDRKGILAVTMPGFGTTGRTYNNAVTLIRGLGAELSEISIKKACLQHFEDIGQDPQNHDVTYENSQARERTQILMDLANQKGGLVIGTGDLSELALGWATYNGDHLSMYGVNSGVPKTLVRHLVQWVSRNEEGANIQTTLEDILATPVSPELIPADENGEISQRTEELVGPYELHDFYLYYMIRWGFGPAKILFYAENAFKVQYDRETLLKWLEIFTRRFFSQQFKRSCLPDGPKVGSINLSPRGDWRMPSDASATLWMNEIRALKAK